MNDEYGRKINYLRISVTDRCNLRCLYCMPADGVPDVGHDQILTYEEIARITRTAAKKGVTRIKLTGGEPLVRGHVSSLIRELKQVPGIEQVTLTTNGVLLADQYEELADAGLDSVTISLDTMNSPAYQAITRRDEFERVIRSLRYAIAQGRMQLKINCVPLPGINEDDLIPVAQIAKEHEVHVRFIEMMPIGLGCSFRPIPEYLIRRRLEETFGTMTEVEEKLGNGPARYYAIPGFRGRIGFISAISHRFCSSCNRVRLTSTGFLKTCLQYDCGTDLRGILRGGGTDQDLERAWEEAIAGKPREHRFGSAAAYVQDREERGMNEIGG
ncbi:GTP 3',8-cyclase MoaA [Clostridium vitabionis]|jgi:cyclic pyranopterin phosphate synthase|uniref:GTP 3',8-cyclase MoaA n=1 Tax=Clostridium vitabionis TaxID=2784388 RepID=UPI00188A65D2|nr:GTP 3',8-cyclase MoaA [Clostridium vitabionis]